jgi:hypothetical protein
LVWTNGVLSATLLLAAASHPGAGSALAEALSSYAAVFAALAGVGAVAVLQAAVKSRQAPEARH